MNIYRILATSIAAILLFSMMLFGIYSHEQAHVQIDKYFGCGNITVKYGLIESSTACNEATVPKEAWAQFQLAHSINEAVGYSFLSLMLLVVAVALLFLPAVWRKE